MTVLGPFLFLVVLVGALIWRAKNRPPSLQNEFERWARSNDLKVVHAQRRYLFAGPFRWKRSGIVFKIEVQLLSGETRKGWIRFGYDFFSKAPWQETVVWDDDALQSA